MDLFAAMALTPRDAGPRDNPLRVYILRHGIAEDAPPGGSDAGRALTPEGKQKLRNVLARASAAKVRPAVILTSPLKRAVQTAEIAAAVLKVKQELIETNALAPSGSAPRVWTEIRARKVDELLIAGHEPLLSGVAAFLLRCPALRLDLKKGALVAIEIETAEPEPHGVLKWVLTPKLAEPA
jgi:phosphohistidine phosphatase